MKDGIKIAFVYIGLVIGAGFASGREILEYFNMKTQTNPLPIILAALLFGLVAYLILSRTVRLGISDFALFVDKTAGKLSLIVKAIMYLFMFCGFFVMLSAGGELFSSAFSVSRKIGILTLCAICFAVFSFDIKGIVALNSVLVPFMIVGIVYLSVSSLLYSDAAVSTFPLSDNMAVSAVCYASYNTITAGAVLVPLYGVLNKRSIRTGVILGSVILGLLIFIIWVTLNIFYKQILSAEMPLLNIAAMRGKIYKVIYVFVMFASICTTAISHGFGILSRFHAKTVKGRVAAAGIFCLAALPFSDLNFSVLISVLYSLFGYFGLIWLAILIFKR